MNPSPRARLEEKPQLLLHRLVGGFEGRPCAGEGSMEDSVWSKVPEEVVERVLLLLPPASKFRFRSVCKRWRALLSSTKYLLSSPTRAPSSVPHLCAVELRWPSERRVGDHSTASKLIHTLDLSFLPSRFFNFGRRLYMKCEEGLVCIVAGLPNETYLHEVAICVVNPITKSWRELAEMNLEEEEVPEGRNWVVQLIAGRGASFKVMFVCDWDQVHRISTAGVFSSDTNSWNVTCIAWVHRGAADAVDISFCHDLVYASGAGNRLLLYKMEDNSVIFNSLIHPFSPLQQFRLLKHGQDMYAVVLSHSPVRVACAIWLLREEQMQWQQVGIRLQDEEKVLEVGILMGDSSSSTRTAAALSFLNTAVVVDDHIWMALSSSNSRLIGFRFRNSLELVLEIHDDVMAAIQHFPVQLFKPRCDTFG